jgi:hypothetical protein
MPPSRNSTVPAPLALSTVAVSATGSPYVVDEADDMSSVDDASPGGGAVEASSRKLSFE